MVDGSERPVSNVQEGLAMICETQCKTCGRKIRYNSKLHGAGMIKCCKVRLDDGPEYVPVERKKPAPRERPERPSSVHVNPANLPKQTCIESCIHRTEQIGFVDCGCSGNRPVYRCGKLFRPNVKPAEPAYCVDSIPVNRTRVVAMDGKTEITKLAKDELIECWPMCDLYEVATPQAE